MKNLVTKNLTMKSSLVKKNCNNELGYNFGNCRSTRLWSELGHHHISNCKNQNLDKNNVLKYSFVEMLLSHFRILRYSFCITRVICLRENRNVQKLIIVILRVHTKY